MKRSSVDDRNHYRRCPFCFNFAMYCDCKPLELTNPFEATGREVHAIEASCALNEENPK